MLLRFAILLAATGSLAFAGAIDFSRDIQPSLSENCYHCHGPDAKARKAELRLDQKEDAMRVQDGVAVVKPGDSKASALVERIFTTDEDDVMLPKKSNRTLTIAPKRAKEPGSAEFGVRIAEWEKREPALGARLHGQQSAREK
jgi:hypothetical protein